MGDRPSFDLFFGIVFEDGEDIFDEEKDSSQGWVDEDDQLEEDESDEEPDTSHYGLMSRYLAAVGKPTKSEYLAEEKFVELTGCVIGSHGYEGGDGLFVAIKNTHIPGDWDSATVLNPEHMTDYENRHDKHVGQIRHVCDTLGMKFSEPKWQIVCSYG